MTAFTLYVISLTLFIMGMPLSFLPLLVPQLLGRGLTDRNFNVAWIGRVLIGAAVIFSIAAFITSKVIA